MQDSNPRHSRCKRDALPAELTAPKTLIVPQGAVQPRTEQWRRSDVSARMTCQSYWAARAEAGAGEYQVARQAPICFSFVEKGVHWGPSA